MVNINNIPRRLTDLNQWICWETELRDGKKTKIPVDPNNPQSRAKTNDPATWGSISEATAANKSNDHIDGIGFVFTDDDPFVGIDLDDCRDPDSGDWDEWALDVIGRLKGFIEISPSGTGAHVIMEGHIPGSRNRRGDIEMYEDARFFTVSTDIVSPGGTRISDQPAISDDQEALEAVYEDYLAGDEDTADGQEVDIDLDGQTAPTPADTSAGGGRRIDVLSPMAQEVVKKAKGGSNGYRFTQMWRGNCDGSGSTYESHSEADLAFCDYLAFYADGDAYLMDEIFRASGLMRPKWDEVRFKNGDTYGERTIAKAIAGTDEHYGWSEEQIPDEASLPATTSRKTSKGNPTGNSGGSDDDPDGNSSVTSSTTQATDAGPTSTTEPDTATPDANSQQSSSRSSGANASGGAGSGGRDRSRARSAGRDTSFLPASSSPDSDNDDAEGAVSDSASGETATNSADVTEQQTGESDETDGDDGTPDHRDGRRRRRRSRDADTTAFETLHEGDAGGDSKDTDGEHTPSTTDSGYDPTDTTTTTSPTPNPTRTQRRGQDSERAENGSQQDGSASLGGREAIEEHERDIGRLPETDGDDDVKMPAEDTRDMDIDREEAMKTVSGATEDEDTDAGSQSSSDSANDESHEGTEEDKPDQDSADDSGSGTDGGRSEGDSEDDGDEGGDEDGDVSGKMDGKDEPGVDDIPRRVESRIQTLTERIGTLEDETAETLEELENEREMLNDKIVRLQRQLDHYEDLAEKRTEQTETLIQLIQVIAMAHGHPTIMRIGLDLAEADGIPTENVFTEDEMAQLKHYFTEAKSPAALEPPGGADETLPTTQESAARNQYRETDPDGLPTVGIGEVDDEDDEEDGGFLSGIL